MTSIGGDVILHGDDVHAASAFTYASATTISGNCGTVPTHSVRMPAIATYTCNGVSRSPTFRITVVTFRMGIATDGSLLYFLHIKTMERNNERPTGINQWTND